MAFKLSDLKKILIVEEPIEDNKENKDNSIKKGVAEKKTVTEIPTEKTTAGETKLSWKSTTSNLNSGEISNPETGGAYSQKIFDSLTKAIFDSNLPGEDYLEFMQALKAMHDIPLEENIKMKTVFATLSTKGMTVQKILESGEYYLKILENEKSKFYMALEGQKKGNLGGKEKTISQLEEQNKEKAELIKKLTEEIQQNTIKIESLRKEINEADTKIKATENDFLFTLEKISSQIKTNIEKVKTLNS